MADRAKQTAAPAPAKAKPLDKAPASDKKPAKHNGLAVQASRGNVARPSTPIQLQGSGTFAPPEAWADYIKADPRHPAVVDVSWGSLATAQPLSVAWDPKHAKFRTPNDGDSIAITHPFFGDVVQPHLFVQIHDDKVTGYATIGKSESALSVATALAEHTEALGLVGFKLNGPKLQNELKDGHFYLGAEAIGFTLGGWIGGSINLGIVDTAIAFAATVHAVVRGLGEISGTITRDSNGVYSGHGEAQVKLGKLSGSVIGKYESGDFAVTGTVKYASEKFNGSLTAVVAPVAQAAEAARGQLDPSKLMETEKVKSEDAGGGKATKGEHGLAAWGTFDFAFTDWLTGSAMGVLDPDGHITVVGKIAPPKQVELLKEHAWNTAIPPFPLEITARYGLPYVADVHLGVGFELGAVARIGPAVLTDISIGGTYSTDPKILQDFSISGAFRISAYAGLNLSIYGKAGLTILKHDIDFIAKLTGSAGVKAYAEARPTIGYRETADPVAGKKGEAYLQGHLEAAAQAFLGLAGDLEIKLTTPWWSPVSDHTWTWPLFDLSYPLGGSIGVGADIDYVIGSGKMPDIKLGKVDFDASKFMDSMLDSQIPSGKGGETEKPGTWVPVQPKPPLAAPPSVPSKPAPGHGSAKAGTPPAKSAKGRQTPEEQANVPKTPDASKRWVEGMEALGELHERAEHDPESDHDIHANLAAIKRQFGFSRLEATLNGAYWEIDAALNPKAKRAASVRASKDGYQGKWPPPDAGTRPDLTSELPAWRYKRYAHSQYEKGVPRKEIYSESEYIKRGYATTADSGGRPGRPGGKAQVAAKVTMKKEGFDINESTELGSRINRKGDKQDNVVDGIRDNQRGGKDYLEVDHLGVEGLPTKLYREKLVAEIQALKSRDTLTFVDATDTTRRIRYTARDKENAAEVVEKRQKPRTS